MNTSNRLLTLILTLITVSFLTACGTTPPPSVTTKTVYKHPSVPDKLFHPVKVERPISDEEYLKMSLSERETYMREYAQKALTGLKSSNDNVKDIKKILEDTKKAADNESKSRN